MDKQFVDAWMDQQSFATLAYVCMVCAGVQSPAWRLQTAEQVLRGDRSCQAVALVAHSCKLNSSWSIFPITNMPFCARCHARKPRHTCVLL